MTVWSIYLSRNDRRDLMEKQLKQANVPFERMQAFDAKLESVTDPNLLKGTHERGPPTRTRMWDRAGL